MLKAQTVGAGLMIVVGMLGPTAFDARGAVVVIANRTRSAIRFEAREQTSPSASADTKSTQRSTAMRIELPTAARAESHTVDAGDMIAVPLDARSTLSFKAAGLRAYDLSPYGVYYLGNARDGKIELREIGLGLDANEGDSRDTTDIVAAHGNISGPPAGDEKERAARRTISVDVFVDDDEPAVQQLWQKRLADRLANASEILERCCGMKLAVRSFGVWESNDAVEEFEVSLAEFEKKVHPREVRLAIGFTSQYQITRGKTHLGGTRGPLHSHILLREWSQHVSESERLELLVHELAHFLGAVHSPEANSVMRPVLGDRQARARSFRITVDPVNALAMSMIGEEVADRGITSFVQLSAPTRARLALIYKTLAQALPKDPAAPKYLQYVQRRPP